MRPTRPALICSTLLLLGACDSSSVTEPVAEQVVPSIEIFLYHSEYELRAGGRGRAIQLSVVRNGGYTDSVRVSLDGVPQGVEAEFQSGRDRDGRYLTSFWVEVQEGAAAGAHTLTLKATGVGVAPVTRTLVLNVIPPIPFSFTTTPGRFRIKRGSQASGVIAIYRKGYNGYVNFSYRKFPGVTMIMSRTATAGDSLRFTIEVSQAADADAYIFPLTGTISGGDSQSVLISVDVPSSVP